MIIYKGGRWKKIIICIAVIILTVVNVLICIKTVTKDNNEASVASEPSVSEAEEEPQPIVQNITNNYNITDSYNNNYNMTENNNVSNKDTENSEPVPEKKEEVVVSAPSNNNIKQSESIEQPVKKETKNTENNTTVKMYHTPLGDEKNDCDPSPNRVLIKGIKCPKCGANTYTENYNKKDINLQHYMGRCSTCYYEN